MRNSLPPSASRLRACQNRGTSRPAEGGSGALPVDITIRALNLPDIALGEAVTGGQVASVAAKGNAAVKASPLSVQSDLTVARTDGTAGTSAGVAGFRA